MRNITNERIAIILLIFLLLGIFFAYIKLENECTRTIGQYNEFVNLLGVENTQNIIPKIEHYVLERINSSNSSISVTYIGLVNGLYKYNITVNSSWDYVYTTIDGRYLFLPYINQFNHLSFDVVSLEEVPIAQ